MKKRTLFVSALLVAITGCSEDQPAPAEANQQTNLPAALREKIARASAEGSGATAKPGTISVQEMLVSGPTQLKLHSLAMITQGNVKGEIDESYLPGLKVCSEDAALPLRSISAQILGRFYVQGQEAPNPEAVDLLIKLAKDESADVRFNAVYHGLSQIQNKSDTILNLLIDIASTHPAASLYDRIVESLQTDREKVRRILDRKLKDEDNVAIYEIYEDLAGQKPANADKYLDMPSSRPHLFILKGTDTDPEASKSKLEQALKEIGIENPDVSISGTGDNHVLLIKTYITKDGIAVKNAIKESPVFKITQDLWLTPELEIQIEAMRKM